MMRHGKMLVAVGAIVGVLALLYAFGTTARAGWNALTSGPDAIHVTDDYVISGDQVGDRAVFARTITVAPDGIVMGDVALVAGRVQMDGRVTGDFSATASQIVLGEFARIDGDATLTGDTVMIAGAVEGGMTISASKVVLGASSRVGADVRVCASTVTDERANAALIAPCAVTSPSVLSVDAGPLPVLLLAAALAGGVLTALPHALAPLRMARLNEGLRSRMVPRLISGAALFGLWFALALLLTLLPGGPITQLLLIVFLGATFILGAPVVWLGTTLAGLWIGAALARLLRRPRTPAPPAALVGGLLISAALALAGTASLPGLVLLGALAVIGLAGVATLRAAGAVGDNPRRTSYFVQG
ncbi:MAG TPA: polymer-forming cytoskeletal protein [Candidatus Limnocylindrales bacterium]|nr:polymer-forming cytoskeletal protein [Candidatus Limnocylindrales bacterium]